MTSEHHHELYGVVIDRRGILKHFPVPENASTKWGIVYTPDSHVRWIMIKVGVGQKYPNDVKRNTIHYCHGPDAKAHESMTETYRSGKSIKVKVVADGSPVTYLWGSGRIVELNETFHDAQTNRSVRRYILERVESDEGEMDQGAESDGVPLKFPRKRAYSAIQTSVDGVLYDSLLERRHALMMKELGIRFQRPAFTFHDVILTGGRTSSYTPDFVVYPVDPESGRTTCLLLEIKPRYPYDDELYKAMCACRTSLLPVVIFFNTSFRCPFEARPEPNGHGDYGHSDGVRGILFSWSEQQNRVVTSHDVAYRAHDIPIERTYGFVSLERRVCGGIGPRTYTPEDACFSHPAVVSAYECASGVCLEEEGR